MRVAFRNIASVSFFAPEGAKLMLAFIVTRDRLSAAKTEVRLAFAFVAREGSSTINAEWLIALFTYEHMFAVATQATVALLTAVRNIAVVAAEPLVAYFTAKRFFAVVAECLITLFT
jgi:hypothetical protein